MSTATDAAAAATATESKKRDKPSPSPTTEATDAEIGPLVLPSLYRLTEGIPRKELKLMVSEAKVCEDALEKELKQLNDELLGATDGAASSSSSSNKKSSSLVDLMLESEVTPPDRYFTVSALLGRLRDPLAMELPPNSVLPALRMKSGLQPQQKKKKKDNSNISNPEQSSSTSGAGSGTTAAAAGTATAAAAPSTTTTTEIKELSPLEKQKQVLALQDNPEYTKEHPTSTLLTLWKKISSHRTSVVFRKAVNPKEAPGYADRILFPCDLSLIRKMIVARNIKSYKDLHLRAGLICHNCVKYNGRESDYGVVTRDFEAMVDDFIVTAVNSSKTTIGRPSSPTPVISQPSLNKQEQQNNRSSSTSPVPITSSMPAAAGGGGGKGQSNKKSENRP